MTRLENDTLDGRTAGEPSGKPRFEPAYLRLLRAGELAARARLARKHLEDCDLCAR